MATRRIPFPREHGAWAMLTSAVLLAWAHPWVRGWPAAVLTVLFVLSFAIQESLRATAAGKRGGRRWIAIYGAVLLAGAGWLVARQRVFVLIPAAGAGVLLTWIDLRLRRRKQHHSFLLRFFGGAGLTLALPAILALLHPTRAAYALVLWALTLAYFASRLVVVRARNEMRRSGPGATRWKRGNRAAQAGLYCLLGAFVALGWATPFVFAAYLPGSWAAFHIRVDLELRRVGMREVAQLAWFVVALLGSYHLGRAYALPG